MAIRHWRWLRIHDRETPLDQLIRLLNERLKKLADLIGDAFGAGDEVNAVEAYLWNDGAVIATGDSDWVFVPFDFSITVAEIVSDPLGSIQVAVYASTYGTWDTWTLISGAAPITLAGVDKAHSPLTGWTTTFTGGTYLKFVVTGTPSGVTKATITLYLSVPNSVLVSTSGDLVSGSAGGVLSGTYPNPGFAEDMATQAELNAEAATRASADTTEASTRAAADTAEASARAAADTAEATARASGDTAAIATAEAYAIQRANHTGTQLAATISDFNSASRAQTEAELVAGTGITITPASTGATRTLTLAASGGGGSGAEVLITETVVGVGGVASVSFTSIATTWRDLRVVIRGRGTKAATFTTITMRVNNDSTAIYDYEKIEYNNTTNFGAGSVAQTSWHIGYLPAATAASGVSSMSEVRIFDYRGTTFHKSMLCGGGVKNATGAPAVTDLTLVRFTGWYRSTSALNRVDVFVDSGNFAQDTVVSLYGIS